MNLATLSRHRPLALLTLLLALAGPATHAAAPDAAFERAFQHFLSALAGDKSLIEKCGDEFEALRAAEPSNPVLVAYVGAATVLRSTNTVLPWKKMRHVDAGLGLIDKALAQLTPAHDNLMQHHMPGSLEVRYIAANTFLAVPSFMGRSVRGRRLLNEVLTSPLLNKTPLAFQGSVWLRAATLANAEKRHADARRYLNEVISHNAPQADRARALLARLGS